MNNTSDLLNSLPYDKDLTPLSLKEKIMIDSLYPPTPMKQMPDIQVMPNMRDARDLPKNVKAIETFIENVPIESRRLWRSFREIIIATILFVILQFPAIDTLVTRFVKTESFYYKLAVKSAIFAIVFFILTNFSLARV